MALGLALAACGRTERVPPAAGVPASARRGPDLLVLRAPRSGGPVRVFAYPRLDSLVWTSTAKAPPLDRILGFDDAAGTVLVGIGQGLSRTHRSPPRHGDHGRDAAPPRALHRRWRHGVRRRPERRRRAHHAQRRLVVQAAGARARRAAAAGRPAAHPRRPARRRGALVGASPRFPHGRQRGAPADLACPAHAGGRPRVLHGRTLAAGRARARTRFPARDRAAPAPRTRW